MTGPEALARYREAAKLVKLGHMAPGRDIHPLAYTSELLGVNGGDGGNVF